MDAGVLRHTNLARLRHDAGPWLAPVIVAITYYAAAQAAFLIGTLSDQIFAPFWPPNAVLFCGLLLTPRRQWWSVIGAVFPAHALAEWHVGMAAVPMLVAFLTNCGLALLNATTLLRFASGSPWFGSIRNAAIYIAATVVVNPALLALGGAFVPVLGAGALGDYFYYWSSWYAGNALASLTLGPIILTWFDGRPIQSRRASWPRRAELAAFVIALVAACFLSFALSVRMDESAFEPAVLYLPLPVILWGSLRFGERGASGAILVLTVISIWLTLNGPSPFVSDRPEKSVLALQLFLIGVAVPILILTAAIDQLRNAERATRSVVGSLMRAQDEERRRIARDLHDSTAQNLVAASLLARSVGTSLAEPVPKSLGEVEALLEQSIKELRLLSYVLHPPQLEGRGLTPALSQYVEGFCKRTGLSVDLQISGELSRLPRETELVLYRIVQETLANVDRHSGSPTAIIRLGKRRTRNGSVAVLAVEDFGSGMSTTDCARLRDVMPTRRGVGLDSMRERVHQIGGRLQIVSIPGKTVVSAIVPTPE